MITKLPSINDLHQRTLALEDQRHAMVQVENDFKLKRFMEKLSVEIDRAVQRLQYGLVVMDGIKFDKSVTNGNFCSNLSDFQKIIFDELEIQKMNPLIEPYLELTKTVSRVDKGGLGSWGSWGFRVSKFKDKASDVWKLRVVISWA